MTEAEGWLLRLIEVRIQGNEARRLMNQVDRETMRQINRVIIASKDQVEFQPSAERLELD